MWGSRRKQQREEDREQIAQLQERVTRLEKQADEPSKPDERSKFSRRIAFFTAFTSGCGLLLGTLTFLRNTHGSDLKISSEVFDKDDLGRKPAGIRFTIRNNGDRIALFKKILIVIENCVRVESCFYGSGTVEADGCYGVTLPVNPEPGMTLEKSMKPTGSTGLAGYEIAPDEVGSFDLALLEESDNKIPWPSENYIPFGNIYRLRVQLVQDDGSVNDAGRFIVDGYIIGTYWQANETYDLNSGSRITREERAKRVSDWEAVIACVEGNEADLKNLVTPDAAMTPKIRRMWEGMRSGTETYQMPTAPSTDTIICSE